MLYDFRFFPFHYIRTTSQTVSFISMINYFSCHFLLMLSYHLLRYSLSLRSCISTIQYQKQQFNTDIPSQDHFNIIVKSGTGYFWIFFTERLRLSVLKLYLFHSRGNFLTFPDPFEIEDLKGEGFGQ